MNSYSENPVTCNFLFSRIHKKVHIWSLQAAERWVGFNLSWSRGVVEALPFLAYTGMCRWTGYGFKGLESSTSRVYNFTIKHLHNWASGSESTVSCLKQGSEMSNFCLKQGQGVKSSAAHLFLEFPWVPPSPPPPPPGVDRYNSRCNKKGGLWQV